MFSCTAKSVCAGRPPTADGRRRWCRPTRRWRPRCPPGGGCCRRPAAGLLARPRRGEEACVASSSPWVERRRQGAHGTTAAGCAHARLPIMLTAPTGGARCHADTPPAPLGSRATMRTAITRSGCSPVAPDATPAQPPDIAITRIHWSSLRYPHPSSQPSPSFTAKSPTRPGKSESATHRRGARRRYPFLREHLFAGVPHRAVRQTPAALCVLRGCTILPNERASSIPRLSFAPSSALRGAQRSRPPARRKRISRTRSSPPPGAQGRHRGRRPTRGSPDPRQRESGGFATRLDGDRGVAHLVFESAKSPASPAGPRALAGALRASSSTCISASSARHLGCRASTRATPSTPLLTLPSPPPARQLAHRATPRPRPEARWRRHPLLNDVDAADSARRGVRAPSSRSWIRPFTLGSSATARPPSSAPPWPTASPRTRRYYDARRVPRCRRRIYRPDPDAASPNSSRGSRIMR